MKECFRREWVWCGKGACRACPHGPYWYAYWREGRKTRKRYVGKERPEDNPPPSPPPADPPPHPHDAIFCTRSRTRVLAWLILGVPPFSTLEVCRIACRRIMRECHPDRFPERARECMRANAAYTFLAAQQ